MPSTLPILGIPFYTGSVEELYEQLSLHGGLLTAPSGPGLASIPTERIYYTSVQASDWVIPDSGYMVLLWNLLYRPRLQRLSGLAFINHFIETFRVTAHQRLFLVNPSADEQAVNRAYFASLGVAIAEEDCYIAPRYDTTSIQDQVLLNRLEHRKPHWVLINIGGGVQEILGAYLKQHLSYRPALLCTGAAIAFKTGKQVAIPTWADRLFLGWLFRIASNPQQYYRRYWEAVPLGRLLWKYQSNQVPPQQK
ncbi:MAG: WecB/TagA/CpsF family glycosyltransferase [Spirosomataceae bacterium]